MVVVCVDIGLAVGARTECGEGVGGDGHVHGACGKGRAVGR